jgi:hypothetical protein
MHVRHCEHRQMEPLIPKPALHQMRAISSYTSPSEQRQGQRESSRLNRKTLAEISKNHLGSIPSQQDTARGDPEWLGPRSTSMSLPAHQRVTCCALSSHTQFVCPISCPLSYPTSIDLSELLHIHLSCHHCVTSKLGSHNHHIPKRCRYASLSYFSAISCSKYIRAMDFQSEDVEEFRQRFAHLMSGEEAAWKMPVSLTPVKVPAASASTTIMAVGRRPLPATAAGQHDDYDSDDPEQVCNARFTVKAPKTQRRNPPSQNVTKQQTSAIQAADPRRLEQLQSRVFPSLGLRIGQRHDPSMTFAPWKLVVEYPYMFIGKANFDKVSSLEWLIILSIVLAETH